MKKETQLQRVEALPWKKITIALTLLIIARGVFVLCVLPPFEGWDEYQHIAYIVYIKEQREIPRYGDSTVPSSMKDMLQRYPHPEYDSAQTAPGRWGTKTYNEFWMSQRNDDSAKDVDPTRLYEGQQMPLYYLLAVPLWSLFSGVSYLAGIYALRLINVLLVAAAVFIFLRTLEICIANVAHRLIIGLLVATAPMYLINAARISSDALTILFGSLTLYFTIAALRKNPFRFLALASSFLALGILSKATMCMMAPVVLTGIVICVYQRRLSYPFRTLAACALIVIVLLSPFYYYHYRVTGGFYQMTEVMTSQVQGKSKLSIWSQALNVGWTTRLREWLFCRELWCSGWSFIFLPTWMRVLYRFFMYAFWGVVVGVGLKRGWGKRLPTNHLEYLFSENKYVIVLGSLVLSVLAGLAWFATLSLANWGFVGVIPSYFMIAFPAWTVFVYQASLFAGRRFAFWSVHILLGFNLVSELLGTLYLMPTAFTATSWSWRAWTRLLELHPIFPSPWFIVPTLALIAGLLIYLFRILWRSELRISVQAEGSAA
ncbi:MAG: glycosyltransferase family 39 protein [Acidobacteriota bacterium]|nr:glycosyltransferase family 39 protein [Acidobacteriota bacterium]